MRDLENDLLNKIQKKGCIGLDEYINSCLYHNKYGYYMASNPLGFKNDFITAPEISSFFGEMIANWIFNAWKQIFNKTKINIVELGVGSGKLIVDILRTLSQNKIFEEMLPYISVGLLEISPILIEHQKKKIATLPDYFAKIVNWHNNLDEIDSNPIFFIANEFFDALPIKAFYNSKGVISEIVVNSSENKLVFDKKQLSLDDSNKHKAKFPSHKDNSILEVSKLRQKYMESICQLLANNNGLALIFDYGYLQNPGNKLSLQAISKHKRITNHLKHIGDCDLTSYVDFNNLINICYQNLKDNMEVNLISQREFLINCGLLLRLENTIRRYDNEKQQILKQEVNYLISKDKFGDFKTLIIANKSE